MLSKEKISILILLSSSFILSLVFLLNNPIEFQCDSALFYNYGSGLLNHFTSVKAYFYIFLVFLSTFIIYLNKDLIKIKYNILIFIFVIIAMIILIIEIYDKTPFPIMDLKRPPFYPLLLVISGTYSLDSLYPIIILQSIMSYLSILMIFKIILFFSHNLFISLFFTLIFIITTIPYILIKFIVAEQFLFFLSVSVYFFMFKYQIEAKTNYLSLGLIFATIAWLTKWEGQLLFFSVILFSLFKLNILKKKDLKLFLHVLIIPVCILLIWVTGRSIVYKDFSNVLSVSNSNSEQFFYKLYTVIPSELYSLNKDLSFENSKNERENLIFDNQKQIQVIIPDNGPYSQKLYDHVNNFIFKNPKSFEALKKPLDEAYQNSEKKIDLYYELFEKFGVDYNSLTNNIFSQPNIYYFNYISNHLDNFIGKDEKDKLFRKSMFESVKNNPNILLIFIFDFFKSYGIDLKNFFKNGKNFYGERLSGTFINPFNAGNCAKSNLTDKAFSEYEISHVNWHNGKKKIDNLVNRIVIYMDFVNDFIVAYLGPLFIVGTIILIFFDYKLFIPLAIFPFSYDFLVAITVDANVNSKYEVITFSLKYILLALFFSLLINLFKKNRYGKK